MQISWKHILINAIAAVLTIPVFLWLVYTGVESGKMVLMACGLLAAVGAAAVLLCPPPRKKMLAWIMQVIGALLFALLMLIVQPGVWMAQTSLLGFSFAGIPFLTPVLWVVGCLGCAWFIQGGMDLLFSLVHRHPGWRDISSAVIFFALFVLFCVVFYSLRLLCPVFTHAWQISADTEWLSNFTWPLFPGLFYQMTSIAARILHSTDQTALGLTVGFQIFCWCATAAFAGSRLYLLGRKFWVCIVYALAMIAWYPCWIYLFALDGVIWTAMAVLLMAASLPVILQEEEATTSSWVCLVIGAFLLCIQLSWGWMFVAAFGVLFVLFTIWKHWQSALGMLVTGLCMVGIFYFALPFGGVKADYSGFMNVPLQHMARVVSLERNLSANQTVDISVLSPLAKIKETYTEHTADPMRSLLNKNDTLSLVSASPLKYWNLYFKLASTYPTDAILSYDGVSAGLYDGSVPKVLRPGFDTEVEGTTPATFSEKNIVSILETWINLTEKFMPFLVSPGFQFWMALFLWAWGCGQKEHMAWSAAFAMLFIIAYSFGISYFSKLEGALPLFVCMPMLWLWPACSFNEENERHYRHPHPSDYQDNASMRKVSQKKAEELFDPANFHD